MQLYFQIEIESPGLRALTKLFEKIVKEPLYDQLRYLFGAESIDNIVYLCPDNYIWTYTLIIAHLCLEIGRRSSLAMLFGVACGKYVVYMALFSVFSPLSTTQFTYKGELTTL